MNYHNPSSFEEASAIAAQAGGTTRFLAGGTDVLVQLRADIVTPDDLIDIKHIPASRTSPGPTMAAGASARRWRGPR